MNYIYIMYLIGSEKFVKTTPNNNILYFFCVLKGRFVMTDLTLLTPASHISVCN